MSRFRFNALLFVFLAGACSKAPGPVREKAHVDKLNAAEPLVQPRGTQAPHDKIPRAQQTQEARWGARHEGSLALGEHLPASAMVPGGQGGSPLRVVVSAHGAGGRGIDHCRFWDRYLGRQVLLVCLTGTPLRSREPEGGAYFKSHIALRKELEETIASVKKRWGDQLAAEDWLYLGYSQGATMGALALLMDPPLVGSTGFFHLVLVEGGGENWSHSRVARWTELGGQAVGLVCGTRSCNQYGERSVSLFEAQDGASAILRSVEGGGHTYTGQVGQAVQDVLHRFGYGRAPTQP